MFCKNGFLSKVAMVGLFSIGALNAGAAITVFSDAAGLHIKSSDSALGDGPEVVLHDDFDAGVAGQLLTGGWSLGSSSGNQSPTYNDKQHVTGSKSGKASFLGSNYNSTAEYKSLPNMDSVYLSYYVKYVHLSGDLSRNIKLARLSAGYIDGYQVCQGTTFFDYNTSNTFYTPLEGANTPGATVWWDKPLVNEWHRLEQYLKLSAPAGAANGVSWLYADQKLIANLSNLVTQNYPSNIKWLTMPYYVAHDPGGDYEMYFDNVVVSKYPSRVEFCEADTYAMCKAPVIPKVKSWSPSEVVVDAAELNKNGRGYIYVFNRNGLPIQSTGISLCQGCIDMNTGVNK